MRAVKWAQRRSLVAHCRSASSSSSSSTDVPARSDNVLEGLQGSNFLSQASDKSHPLIKGISKLLDRNPANPRFQTKDLQKLQLKANSAMELSMQRLRKRKWKQLAGMKPIQYLILMSQWIKKGGAIIGHPMFEQMLKVGVEPVDAYTTMVKHFVTRAMNIASSIDVDEGSAAEETEKCILEALKYLHEMREKGITPKGDTYEPLVTWFLKNDKVSEFEEILEWIKGDGVCCYNSLFKAFGKLGRHEEANQYFNLVKEMGVAEDLQSEYLHNYMKGIISNDKLETSCKAFRHAVDDLKVKPLSATYSILIHYASRTGQIHQALDFIQEMQEKGLELYAWLFHPLMIAFLHGAQYNGVFELFSAMERMGVEPSSESYNYLLRASAKTNNLDKMFKTLAKMKKLRLERTTDTYNSVIQALGSAGQFTRALSVLQDMERDSVKPDAGTMMELIFASPDSRVALEIFHRIRRMGVRPTDSVYSYLFGVMLKDGELDKAIEMLQDPEASFRIGTIAKSTLLGGLAEGHRLQEALVCYDDITRGGRVPEPFAFGSLIRAVGFTGQLDRMFELIDHYNDLMPKKHDRFSKEHTIRCFMNATKACIIHNQLGRLETFFRKEQDFDPTVIFDSLILDIANGEDMTKEVSWSWKDAFPLYDIMFKFNLKPSRIFSEALLDGCVVLKDADRADKIVEQMERDGLQLNAFSFIRLLRVYVASQKIDKAANVLHRMKPFLRDEDVFLLAGQILNTAGQGLQKQVFDSLERPNANDS